MKEYHTEISRQRRQGGVVPGKLEKWQRKSRWLKQNNVRELINGEPDHVGTFRLLYGILL